MTTEFKAGNLTKIQHEAYGPLDEIRGLAALAVLTIHYIQLYSNVKSLGPFGAMADVLGVWGVSIFFILSGFLIHITTLKEYDKTNLVSWKKYFFRRFFRIYPAFFVCLLISFGVGRYAHTNMITSADVGNLFTHILMISTYFQHHFETINAIFWTVVVEVHFYALYPIIWWFLKRYSISKVFLSTFIIGLVYFIVSIKFTEPGLLRVMHQHTSIALFWKWILGVVLAEIYFRNNKKIMFLLDSSYVSMISLALCFLPVIFMQDSVSLQFQRFVLPILSFIFFSGLVFSNLKNWNNIYLKWVGKVSYSLYLWHPLVLLVVGSIFHTGGLIPLLLSFFLSLTLAWLSYKVLEVPFISLGRKLSNRSSRYVK